jgi:C1A family cysteine protease
MHDTALENQTEMKADEFKVEVKSQKKYGWKRDLPDKRDKKHSFLKLGSIQYGRFYFPYRHYLPSKIDLRDKCPDIYDQGELGSCTANAIAAAYQFDEIKQATNASPEIFGPSRLFIYYNERNLENTVDTDAGASIRDSAKTINKTGVCHESLWPYIISKYTIKPTKRCYDDAKTHKSIEYKSLDQNLNDFKSCLNAGFPFVFGFMVYESFETDEVKTTGKMPMPDVKNEKAVGGHAVMAVGYDDSISSIIVRNSWGATWGDKGYFYMPYDYIVDSDLAGDFWTISKIST